MKYLLENEQARKIDEFAIEKIGIPSIVLMENAARSAAEFIRSKTNTKDSVLLLCGMGNNGGDGLAIARHLHNFGNSKIDVVMVGNFSKQTPDNKINFDILKKLNFNISYIEEEIHIDKLNNEYNVIIDALLGIGAKKQLGGTFSLILNKINAFSGLKIAIDLATGVDSDTGFSDKSAFKSDYTVSMFSSKVGLFINQGKKNSGKVINAYLGISNNFLQEFSNHYIIEFDDLKNLIPQRKIESSKFDYGRILIIGGSEKYPGAAALAANACIKSGAGLVELFSNHFHPALLPEIIQIKGPSDQNAWLLSENSSILGRIIDKYDVIAMGPGLGSNKETIKFVSELIYTNLDKKMVIDADGLKGIVINKKLSQNIVLTPHIYEFINVFQLQKDEVFKNPYHFAKLIAKEYDCNILLKGTPSIITNGEESYFNIIGNSGMATAGSGDVLTGIISYYASQISNLLLATAIATFIHSYAGDLYTEKFNKESLTASELINMLKEVKIDYK